MKSALNWLSVNVIKQRLSHITHCAENPHDVQKKVFDYLIHKGRYTAWGQKYSYHQLRSVREYKQRVPISTYEDLFPYIERILKGEQEVLWPSEIKLFAKSSGTTNARSKFIPVSQETLEDCHFEGGKDLLAVYIQNRPETKLFKGRSLTVGGSIQANPEASSTIIGDVSGLIMKNLPLWAQSFRAPSLEIALMAEWEAKIQKMAEASIQENITCIHGVPTWTIFLIRKVLELTQSQSILEVWPNLECFFHGAVAFGPYKSLFESMIPSPQMSYLEAYNASEGFFSLQDVIGQQDMLLMTDYGIFYEFLPLDSLQDPYAATLSLDEVELHKNYALVISTNSGLWRYLIGDTVKFVSKDPYRIRISGRTKHFINAFGEELVIENADHALVEACSQTGARVSNFTAAPIFIENGKRGGHEWLIEFDQQPSDINLFTDLLDKALQRVNSDYEAKRSKDIALLPPLVRVLPFGTFYELMRRKGKLGGQNKVPRLANDRLFIEEVLALLQG
ncbi:MAG: hypothetical protein EAZ57_04970 [Cytophagales bacterium]|nr:MAG: hypothetical protein EAZ67_00910 [Cytophagales bacterium]TAF61144.1 MAG: hypothetical protein EAZ57_04970 [Cytophagales bacterium]